jgi:glycosyltransferase involved in cell wall biosynthesis
MTPVGGKRLAYLCLQATTEGQASYAHVHEIIDGLRGLGWSVELYEPSYRGGGAPGIVGRLAEFRRIQRNLVGRLAQYDAVYVRGHFLARTTSRAARRAGVPVVQECNGPYADLLTAWPIARVAPGVFESMQREQFRDADAVIAVTPELAQWVNREGRRSDTTVVPNGANTDVFAPGLDPLPDFPARYAIFFGALAAWQGVGVLLDAIDDPAWPSDVQLVIAGDGALRETVERAAAHNPRVTYVGALPYADAARAVANSIASLVVKNLPQHARSGLSPLKLYESMAAGVPVIASDLPGLAETVVSADCGLVVAAGDASAVARAVAKVAADPSAAAQMGARGRAAAVAEHSWKARAAATAAVIERVARV